MTERATGSRVYLAGVGIALATALVTAWTTVVRDDGNGLGFLLVIVAAAVAAFSAWFRPAGMARAMLGVAVMQVLVGIAVATAPSVASVPGASLRALLSGSVLAVLWLISASCFHSAAKRARQAKTARASMSPPTRIG